MSVKTGVMRAMKAVEEIRGAIFSAVKARKSSQSRSQGGFEDATGKRGASACGREAEIRWSDGLQGGRRIG